MKHHQAVVLLSLLLSLKSAIAAPSNPKNVIVQMFQWDWDSIAYECTTFLGPAGYGFVQASPAQEHVQGPQWWTDYQPVSYTLTSKRGNRTQYQNMIQTCNAAGVQVIADTIFNHMSGASSGTGVAGSQFTQYNYPGIYSSTDFHYCGLEPNNLLVNYDNAVEVYTCQLDGLADLATDTDEHVRETLANYASDLLSLGVTGLRLDAAKSINASDLANITSRLYPAPYLTQEVVYGYGQPVQPSLYVGVGDVQEFRYTSMINSAFSGGGLSTLQNLNNEGWIAGNQANVFVSNHDTERGGDSLNYMSPSNTYYNAMIFSLAYPYGTPTILSSYTFDSFDQGAPNGNAGTCYGNGGLNGWLCQHRWFGVAGMVGFYNTVGSAPLINWVSPQASQIAFDREALGFIAFNNADTPWISNFTTSLPAGSYCDVVSGLSSSGSCTGYAFTVLGGTVTVVVPPRTSIALHSGSKGFTADLVSVYWEEEETTIFGENLFLVGNLTQLGSWVPSSGIPLSAAAYPIWTGSVTLPPGTSFEYKFLKLEPNGTVIWESGVNRIATTPSIGSQLIETTWK